MSRCVLPVPSSCHDTHITDLSQEAACCTHICLCPLFHTSSLQKHQLIMLTGNISVSMDHFDEESLNELMSMSGDPQWGICLPLLAVLTRTQKVLSWFGRISFLQLQLMSPVQAVQLEARPLVDTWQAYLTTSLSLKLWRGLFKVCLHFILTCFKLEFSPWNH